MKRFIIVISILATCGIQAKIQYYKNIFGNVLRNANNYSASLTTISCGHPVKIVKNPTVNSRWQYVSVGAYKGYLPAIDLSKKRPHCFQDKYPRFFEKLELDLAEFYYWGKLYNQYVQGKSKVR